MTKPSPERICFVIAPIGDEGSETRRRSDQVLKHIIGPAAEACGYTVIRSDRDARPGIITHQIIQHLLDDPLVVADLTEHNPNVFYELALRHAVRKPVIHLIEVGQKTPFDVGPMRVIQVDHHDMDSVEKCRENIVAQIRAVEKDPGSFETPISTTVNLRALGQPLEQYMSLVLEVLGEVRRRAEETLERLDEMAEPTPGFSNVVLELLLKDVERNLTLMEGEDPVRVMQETRNQIAHMRAVLRRGGPATG